MMKRLFKRLRADVISLVKNGSIIVDAEYEIIDIDGLPTGILMEPAEDDADMVTVEYICLD